MELWDVLNSSREKTGKLIRRGDKMENGEYHLVVFAFIRNSDGKFIISKRSPDKTFPGKWEITGGAAISGDDSLSAVIREVKEELGIDLKTQNGKIIKSVRVECDSSYFADIWLFEQEFDMDEIVCQPEEVSEVKIVSKETLISMVENGQFIRNEYVTGCLDYP